MKRFLIAIIAAVCLTLTMPAIGAELNLGGGTPLWDTHTDDDNTSLDGGWLFFASVDRPTKAKPWLSYGLMYNYARIEIQARETTTKWEYKKWDECDGCLSTQNDIRPIEAWSTTTTTHTNDWLDVHVLGPYVKPTWQMSKHFKAFAMVGAGAMYVDGLIYGDEFGAAGFASAGLGVDITEHLGLGAQLLYVKGATSHVDDIDYLAPVATISYRW